MAITERMGCLFSVFTKERGRRGTPVDKHGPIFLGEFARNRLLAQRLERECCQPRLRPRGSAFSAHQECLPQSQPWARAMFVSGTPCPSVAQCSSSKETCTGAETVNLAVSCDSWLLQSRLRWFTYSWDEDCRQGDLMSPSGTSWVKETMTPMFPPPCQDCWGTSWVGALGGSRAQVPPRSGSCGRVGLGLRSLSPSLPPFCLLEQRWFADTVVEAWLESLRQNQSPWAEGFVEKHEGLNACSTGASLHSISPTTTFFFFFKFLCS